MTLACPTAQKTSEAPVTAAENRFRVEGVFSTLLISHALPSIAARRDD
jgi:hypothetical protein